jgi:hypothetical protein
VCKNKAIDNLETDIDFDGDAIQIALQGQLQLYLKTTTCFKMKYFEG